MSDKKRISGTVKSAFADLGARQTEIVMERPGFDDWTLVGETVPVVMALRAGDPLTVEFAEDGRTARVVAPEQGTELVPFGPSAVDDLGEIVDGEIVAEVGADIRWTQTWIEGRDTTRFVLEVDQSWYQRVDRLVWDELNAYVSGLVSIQKRTR
jgi:hypothetical protein